VPLRSAAVNPPSTASGLDRVEPAIGAFPSPGEATEATEAGAAGEPGAAGEVELSVLVVCRNGAPKVPRFLPEVERALRQFPVRTEIVFVDDASTDGTADAARAAVPSARVVALARQRGSSGARNAAAEAATGHWLLLCDDDVELTNACLQTLWRARQPGHCVIPLLRDLRGDLQNAITTRWRWGDLKLVSHTEPVKTVAYPDSACMLLTRDLYWQAGGFDERFQPNCYEDVAFGFALDRVGALSRMVPDATIVHYVHGTDGSGLVLRSLTEHLDQKKERIYRNRWLFDLLVLRGWRRWMVVGLGVPRTALESLRERSVGPVRGYAHAWRAFLKDRH